MSVPAFGFFVVALGLWCQVQPYRWTMIAMFALTPLAGMAALDLPALGGASITPANVFILFYLARLLGLVGGPTALFKEVTPRRPLFIFALLLIWTLGSALLLPRLFSDATYVFSLQRTVIETGAVPLHPTSGNISQAIYAAGGFAMACITSALARREDGPETALTAVLVVTWINIGFSFLDIVSGATKTGFILDLVHTANYSFLADDDIGGVKRLAGSFMEASAYAYYSMSLLAANFALYMMNVRPRVTGAASALLTLFIVLSTSSAGYAALGVFYGCFFIYAVYAAVFQRIGKPLKLVLLLSTLVVLGIATVVLFFPTLSNTAWSVIEATLINKGTSSSAYERGTWNEQALQVFFDTYGLGAGIGATRCSNYILVLLSNLGVIGFGLFVILLARLMFGHVERPMQSLSYQMTWASRVAVAASLVPPLFVGTVYDLGTIFYAFLGLAAAGVGGSARATASSSYAPRVEQPAW